MQKRAFERIPAKVQAILLLGNTVYSGVAMNLSEKGMFISTKSCFPVDSVLKIALWVNDKVLTIPVNVRRSVKGNDFNDKAGMGVKLLDSPPHYLEYVDSLRSSLR